MRILVTGGAGFIGSAVVRYLIKETAHEVLNLDKLTYAGGQQALSEVASNERYTFRQIDICNRRAVTHAFRTYKPDAVMHLAAESHVDRSIESPGNFIQTNIVGTYVILEAMRSYYSGLSAKQRSRFRFLHVSTDEVYGDQDGSDEVATEETRYAPSSPYAASKASADHLVRSWGRTYALPVLISNSSNTYGPYQFPEKLIPAIITSALQRKPLRVYGDGDQKRDWIFVEDHVRALVAVLSQGCIGASYNISGLSVRKNIEVATAICQILDDLVPLDRFGKSKYEALITNVADRPGHDRCYALNTTKIQSEIDWRPSVSFEVGLRHTVSWFISNMKWWEKALQTSD
jgi:dTDP-glucose 4,6-dehydratase